MSGRLTPFTPQEVKGIGTPFITDHLKPGAITYNANGSLNQLGGTRKKKKGGMRSRHIKRTKKINRYRRTKTYSAGGKKNKKSW